MYVRNGRWQKKLSLLVVLQSIPTSLHCPIVDKAPPALLECAIQLRDVSNATISATVPPVAEKEPHTVLRVPQKVPPVPQKAPSIELARSALYDIHEILYPPRNKGSGYKKAKIDDLLRKRLEMMRIMLSGYVGGQSWMAASLRSAQVMERGYHCGAYAATKIRSWTRAFIVDRKILPISNYGTWTVSRLDDENLAQELLLHLQGIGEYVKAQDIITYLADPDTRARFQLKKNIHLATAQRWMHKLRYRWTKKPSGQYVDGHERPDVVAYRQNVFLPAWKALEPLMRSWEETPEGMVEIPVNGRAVVVSVHDESTYYANDRRTVRWVHEDETAKPRAKGKGASMMVADFVSADYGWLRSPDGKETARVLFRARKNRDGYFESDDIIAQAMNAIKILKKHYPHDNHVLVYDNATTHRRRAEDALSARKMPKNPANWGVPSTVIGPDGKPVYGPDGKVLNRTDTKRPAYSKE